MCVILFVVSFLVNFWRAGVTFFAKTSTGLTNRSALVQQNGRILGHRCWFKVFQLRLHATRTSWQGLGLKFWDVRGHDGRTLVATCLGSHSDSIVSRVPVGSCKLESNWKLQKPKNLKAFCSVRWLLEVFLVFAEFAGFRAGGRLPFGWLYWILYCALLAPLTPSRLLPRFRPDRRWIFQSIPL